jgi:5-methyltetrahydrofolate--homocysteine methyltransferase
MSLLQDIKQTVIDMDKEKSAKLVNQALDKGSDAEEILNEALTPAMDQVGDEYEKGNLYVPEMLMSAEAMKAGMELLRPLLAEADVKPAGKVVMGTVEGDLHDIGQNLVSMMLEGAGFEVINLGAEVTADKFIAGVRENDANLVGLSALLTTTMTHMPEVIEALQEAGVRKQVKVMVGGAPVTQEYASEIGADGYAPDAASATKLAKKLAS